MGSPGDERKRGREDEVKVSDDGKRRRSGNLTDVSGKSQQQSSHRSHHTSQSGHSRTHQAHVTPSAPARNVTRDDGHFDVRLGENLTPRFKILAKLGEGTFAQVLEVWDRDPRERRAAKVVKAIRKYRHAARVEVDLLKRVQRADPSGERSGIIPLVHHFEYEGHVVMVFPKLGASVYDFLRRNRYQGFPIEHVRQMAAQMIRSINFLHDLGMIHTDLKPENLLIREAAYTKDEEKNYRTLKKADIVTIDLGSAILSHQHHSTVITTRHYRPPEVILQLGWSFPADMYAIGCILVELVTGEAVYQTHDTHEHLAMMGRVMGRFPEAMVGKIRDDAMRKYLRGGLADYPRPEDTRESIRAVNRCKPISEVITSFGSDTDRAEFLSLVDNLLSYEPKDRYTAKEALRHPFIAKFFSKETSADDAAHARAVPAHDDGSRANGGGTGSRSIDAGRKGTANSAAATTTTTTTSSGSGGGNRNGGSSDNTDSGDNVVEDKENSCSTTTSVRPHAQKSALGSASSRTQSSGRLVDL